MSRRQTRLAQISMIATSLCLAGWISLANAKEEASVLVQKDSEPVAAPKLSPPANAAASETLPPPSNPAVQLAQPTTGQPTKRTAKKPFMRPAEPPRRVPATTALAITDEPMPAPEVPGIESESHAFEVHKAPPIEYDTDGDARRMYRKSGEVNVVMIAKNPADGCHYEIPMCIPACCIGEPTVSSGRGLLGRGVVEFCWDCGFRAEVKFRHVLGDVKVEYEGD